MIYDNRKEAVRTNWTHDTVAALVAKTPFLSADGDTVFTGRLESDVVSQLDLCDENTAVVCLRETTADIVSPLFGRTTWTLEASDARSGELRWRATTSQVGAEVSGVPLSSHSVASPRGSGARGATARALPAPATARPAAATSPVPSHRRAPRSSGRTTTSP